MHLPRFPTYALALLVSAGLAAPSARALDNDKGKKDPKRRKREEKNDADWWKRGEAPPF